MPILEEPGVFSMLVPEGWRVTQAPGGPYELTRPGDDGALHVSTYQRTAGALGETEARDAMGRLLGSIHPDGPVDIRVLPESSRQHRAVARCTTTSEDGSRFAWLAFVVLWKPTLVVCTCTASPGSPLPDEAEQMFASIFPPKRGLLRRR